MSNSSFTVVTIATVMSLYGFTEGILVGVILACVFFGMVAHTPINYQLSRIAVVQSSEQTTLDRS